MKGVLEGIFICPHGSGSFVSNRVNMVRVLENGFDGDKHQGWFRASDTRAKRYPRGTRIWNSRQISIVSVEELEVIAQELGVPKIEPEWLGANMCVSGILDLSLVPPRTKIFIPNDDGGPEVGMYVTAPNKPCIGPGEVIQAHYPDVQGLATRFPKVAMGKRGVVAVVEHGGVIRGGVEISVVIQ